MTSDVAFTTFSDEITAAREALLDLVKQHPDEWRQAYELKTKARERGSAGAVSVALNRLIDDRTLEVDKGRVRLRS